MKQLQRLLRGVVPSAFLALLALAPTSASQEPCQAGNARNNSHSPLVRGYDFVPVTNDDAYGFYVVYSERIPAAGSGSTATVGNTAGIFVFDLGNHEILIFGSGYGNHPVAVNDARFDAARVHEVVESCMGYNADEVRVRFAVPHGHSDHVNGAFLRSLLELGFTVVEIIFHRGDYGLVNGVGGWTDQLRATFNPLRGGDPRNGRPCGEELQSYLSPLGKIWFVWRASHHTNGAMDLVLDVFDNPSDRMLILGSAVGGLCPASPQGTRLKIKAHGNVRVSGGSEPPDEPADGGDPPAPSCCEAMSYGCDINPNESLVLMSGLSSPGEDLQFGVDNPLGTQRSGSIPVVWFSWRPDPAYPCGSLAENRGMGAYGAVGELLVPSSPKPFKTVVGPAWSGPGEPAPITLSIPNNEHLIGRKIYAQGRLIDGGGSLEIGLTNGLEVLIEAP